MKKIVIKSCLKCPFDKSDGSLGSYCKISTLITNSVEIDKVHSECPLKKDDIILTVDEQND